MKHIQKTLKERWITGPMNYDVPQPKRHTHSYMTMYQNQLKTNKGLLTALSLTVIVAFGYGVGANTYYKRKLTKANNESNKCMTAYQRSEGAYNEVVSMILTPDNNSPESIIDRVFGKDAPEAKKVFTCESHLKADATHKNNDGSLDVGIAQINSVHSIPESYLKNPMINILVAKQIFDAQGWNPWTCKKAL